ncbi:group 1 glycosyl transferase [Cupriavidus sp. 2TAF22]|uniref:glycosyltransferase n=1 Tax=unclassified Cupriavidus TaxID=2640874 RepID=UPI003F8DA8C9
MPDPTALIIEHDFTGHRWRYVEWAMQAYREAGYHCMVATDPSNRDHPLARRLLDSPQPHTTLLFVPAPAAAGDGLGRIAYVRFWRMFRHAFRIASAERAASLVVVPYADYFLYILPLLGSPFGAVPWVGITMRANFHHSKVGVKAPRRPLVNAVKTWLFRRALGTGGMKTLLSIDPTLPQWCARAGGRTQDVASIACVAYLADPCPDALPADPAAARARFGLGEGAHLLVYGAITERKGICELVAALAGRPHAPALVVAGQQDAQMRAFLSEAAPALLPPPLILDRFITDEEEAALFCACDAVWLGYKGHYGMSGVLVQAYRAGKPVIATADGLIGWFCHGRELGPVLEDLSVAAIGRALDQLASPARAMQPAVPAQGPPRAHLLAHNTLSEFKQTLRRAAI